MGRCVIYNFANISDYKIFPSRTLKTDTAKFYFTESKIPAKKLPQKITYKNKESSFENFLESKSTVAFLIVHNDTMLYEKYFNGYNQSSVIPAFSVSKAITSTLIGCALDDGYIVSVEQPVTDFVPELKSRNFDKVTLRNLLQMTSGLDFSESYINPFSDAAAFYYGLDLRGKVNALKLKSRPGTKFEYASGNTVLLGLTLERAIKTKSITQYLEEKIWRPMGMEYEASWSIDQQKNGLEKTFCCLNASARDFAKLGRLYLNKGNWNGKQIISEKWISESTAIDTSNGSTWNYQYQWWIASTKGDFYAEGMLGQFIYINPEKKLVIVRMGEKGAGVDWPRLFIAIAAMF